MVAERPGEGKLKIILGYAAGVGKTFRMLEDGQQLAAAGSDVVIGYFEPHGRADTIAKTAGLEVVSRRVIDYRGKRFEEMDTEAILARRPQICLVDEFPHTNVPGSIRRKRWEDVLVLLGAGIDVITTMNIQHLESLNDQIHEISGVQVRETIPDWMLKRAEDLVLVDLTPGALLNRLDRGVVYAPEKAKRAKENFFKEPTLAALREMALRQAAHEVELKQPEDLNEHVPGLAPQTAEDDSGRERILIHVTAAPSAAALIRRGRRVADYLRADCLAAAVLPDAGEGATREQRDAIARHLEFARKLRIETRILSLDEHGDEAKALVDFAHRIGITQLFVSKPPKSRFAHLFPRQHVAMGVIRQAKDLQVTVVADRGSRIATYRGDSAA